MTDHSNTSFSTSIKKGNLLFTSSITNDSLFCTHPEKDLFDQASLALKQLAKHCANHGMKKNDLMKLVIYYADDGVVSEFDLLKFIARQFDCELLPVVTLIPFNRQHPHQIKIIIDAVGMHTTESVTRLDSESGLFSQAIRCDEIIFIGAIDADKGENQIQHPHDIVQQSHFVLAKLDKILEFFGASRQDIVKINNWYVAGGSAQQWSESAKVRAQYYPEPGPVATGLPVNSLGLDGLLIRTDCWAMIDIHGQSINKQFSWPKGHWDWPIHLPFKHGLKCRELIFIGGQVSMDSQANVIDQFDISRQSHTSMKNIDAVLNEFGASLADVVKMSAFYQSRHEPDDLQKNLAIRYEYFNQPAPQSVSIPLDYLAYPGMLTEFEVIAVDHDSSMDKK